MKNYKTSALSIALVGVMAATVECAKLALAALPNIEVVTLLIAVFSYTFGSLGFAATLVFVMIEPLIWGFGGWFITYLIYWPALSLCFILLGRAKIKNIFILTLTALIMTAIFGVLSSAVDVGLFSGTYEKFGQRFLIYYARGIGFYLSQLLSNLVAFPLLFKTLSSLLLRLAKKFS